MDGMQHRENGLSPDLAKKLTKELSQHGEVEKLMPLAAQYIAALVADGETLEYAIAAAIEDMEEIASVE